MSTFQSFDCQNKMNYYYLNLMIFNLIKENKYDNIKKLLILEFFCLIRHVLKYFNSHWIPNTSTEG